MFPVEKILITKYIYKKVVPKDLVRVDYNELRTIINSLIRKGIFKNSRERAFILNQIDCYLLSYKQVRISRDAATFNMAIALIELYYDHRPNLLKILDIEGITLKQWCMNMNINYNCIWIKPHYSRYLKAYIAGYHFAQEQARKRTHPDC